MVSHTSFPPNYNLQHFGTFSQTNSKPYCTLADVAIPVGALHAGPTNEFGGLTERVEYQRQRQ